MIAWLTDHWRELFSEGVKLTPAGTNLTLFVFGVSIQTWVALASLVLIVCQLYFLFRKNLRKEKTYDR